MKLKRILSGVIGLPIVALILIFGNIYVIDVVFALVAIIAIHEYFNSFKKECKPVRWLRILILYINCIYTCNSKRTFANYTSIINIFNDCSIIYTSCYK